MHDPSTLRCLAGEVLRVPVPLHDYQWEGVGFLYRSRSALLADEMGLGKTVQASVALALLLNGRTGVRRALIVAPASLTTNWMKELETWAPTVAAQRVQGDSRARQAFYLLPIPVLVSSYEQVRNDAMDQIPASTFDLVILDEAQRIKHRNSRTALACRLLPRGRAWALSATPLENDEQDIASILSFLDPRIEPNQSRRELSAHLESLMLRRRKTEVRAELPPVILQDLKLELSAPQRTRYDELWVNRAETIGASPGDVATALLALITRLKIVCNTYTNRSSKLDALTTISQEAGEDARILVFSQFVETLKWISDRIRVSHDLLTGSMSIDERQAAIHRFRTGTVPRVLLVSLRAGGVGLNLGEATHVVLFDRWWNPAVEMQAIYRAHRFHRSEPLHVIRFLVVDSIEERIASILDRKEALFSEIVESPESIGQRFTTRELMRIVELAAGDLFPSRQTPKENSQYGEDR